MPLVLAYRPRRGSYSHCSLLLILGFKINLWLQEFSAKALSSAGREAPARSGLHQSCSQGRDTAAPCPGMKGDPYDPWC